MKKNMGGLDRTLRVIVAIIIAVLYYQKILTGTLGLVLIILAGIFILTSLVSFCPLYLPFGLKTTKEE